MRSRTEARPFETALPASSRRTLKGPRSLFQTAGLAAIAALQAVAGDFR